MSDATVELVHRAGRRTRARIHYPDGFTVETWGIPADYRDRPWLIIPSRDYASRGFAYESVKWHRDRFSAERSVLILAHNRQVSTDTFSIVRWDGRTA